MTQLSSSAPQSWDLFDRLAGRGLDGNTHASLVSLADRLASNHLGHQTFDAFIDPFHTFSLSRTRVGLQIAVTSRREASKGFSLRRMLHVIRASLFARAVASLLRCSRGAAFRSHVPKLKRC